ncbi:hypothetical protein [Kitasatospora sp. NPDC051705]|uniref:hypothetical protein n=1 Tax=Kitasatospora sp. NPDC051705 TaxID=3364057 RepID=UPI0037B70EA7
MSAAPRPSAAAPDRLPARGATSHGVMPSGVRLRVALLSALPVLGLCALVLTPLAWAGLLPWAVPPSVLVAAGVQACVVHLRLGRRAPGA